MSHSFVKNHIHLVFGTKDRRVIIAKEVQPELWSYMAGICRNRGMAAIAVGRERFFHSFFLQQLFLDVFRKLKRKLHLDMLMPEA